MSKQNAFKNHLRDKALKLSFSLAITIVPFMTLSQQAAMPQATLWQSFEEGGQKALKAARYTEAERLFSEAVEAARSVKDKGARLGQSLINLASCYTEEGNYKKAEEMFKQAIVVLEENKGGQSINMALLLNNLASMYEKQARFNEAEQFYRRAISMGEKAVGAKQVGLALGWNNLAQLLITFGRFEEAEKVIKHSDSLFNNDKKKNSLNYAVLLYDKGYLQEARGHFKEAEAYYHLEQDVMEKVLGNKAPLYGKGMQGLALLYVKEGKYKEAEAAAKQAYEIMKLTYNSEHPDMATARETLATVYLAMGLYHEAEPQCKQALEIRQKAFGKDSALLSCSLVLLARTYQQLGNYSEARPLFQQTLNLREREVGHDHTAVAQCFKYLGALDQEEGKYAESLVNLDKALAIDEAKLGPDHPEVAEIVRYLAIAYAHLGKTEQAEEYYKKSIAALEKSTGNDNDQYASSVRELAAFYVTQNKTKEAIELYQQVLSIDETTYGATSAKVAGDLETLAKIMNKAGDAAAKPLIARAAEIKKSLPGSAMLSQLANSQVSSSGAPGSSSGSSSGVSSTSKVPEKPVADKWALVVGISNFKDPSINLKYAAKDATDFRNYLISKGNFQPDHVKLLVDGSASRQNIIDQLGDKWLGRVANRDDLVVVYVSSHGSGAMEQAGGVNFLVAHDTNKNSLLATGIPMQWLTNMVKEQVHSERTVIIMDVCHGGSAAPAEKGLTRNTGLNLDKLSLGNGQAVLCSSLADQVSWESKTYQNSVFTRRLIEGLESKGNKTNLADAYDYLRDAVESEVLRDRGELQTPVLNTKLWLGSGAILAVEPAKPRPNLK
jgi:tetratricopeptide (TPR) repeat protein